MSIVKETPTPVGHVTLQEECDTCGHREFIVVPEDQYIRWRQGAAIYHAFPGIPASEARVLDSGQCADCQRTAILA